jgi:lipid-A-disaccharide synthase-like uncharacterized protein
MIKNILHLHTYLHTYNSRFIPDGVAEASQIFVQTRFTLKFLSYEKHCRRGKPIAVWSQLILGVSAICPLVAFYDIHGRKEEVLFFYFVPNTTRDFSSIHYYRHLWSYGSQPHPVVLQSCYWWESRLRDQVLRKYGITLKWLCFILLCIICTLNQTFKTLK